MLELLEKLMDEEFKDVFKPASEEEVERRRQVRIAQYKKESKEWIEVKGKSVDKLMQKLEVMRVKRLNLRVSVKAFLQGAPESVQEFIKEKDPSFFRKLRNYFSQDISDTRLIKTLNRVKELKNSAERTQ